jgi:hypothetical protein
MSRQIEASPVPARTIPDIKAVSFIGYVLSRRVLKRNLVIALIVGGLLTVANQYDVISRGPIPATLLVKICFNFAIPFAVSSVSAYANRCGP